MSWSKSLSGTPEEIRAQLDAVAEEVKKSDEWYSSTEAIVDGHQRQIAHAKATVEKFLEVAPEGHAVSASISGHTDGVNSDSVSVSLSCYKPAV
jgi:outer membrane protein OmpA-like peptidoglycan-associated protein